MSKAQKFLANEGGIHKRMLDPSTSPSASLLVPLFSPSQFPETHLPRLPRMADFASWVTACETALWPSGTFWEAYAGNRDEAVEGLIEGDPVAAALRSFMLERTVWTGTASALLPQLADIAGKRVAESKTWPNSPRALAGRIRRAAPALRKIAIDVTFDRSKGRKRNRLIRIAAVPVSTGAVHGGRGPSTPSAASAAGGESPENGSYHGPPARTVEANMDANGEPSANTVRRNHGISSPPDATDGADANCLPRSGSEHDAGHGDGDSQRAGRIHMPPLPSTRNAEATDQDCQVELDERAAILEYVHGLSRIKVEIRAEEQCQADRERRRAAQPASIAARA